MALDDTIAELLRRQAAQKGAPATEPDAKVEWSNDVDAVMDQIRAVLTPHIEAGAVALSSEMVEASEELLGPYPIQRLTVDIAGVRIIVEPIARYTFGGTGRIDMYRENRPSESDRLLILRPTTAPGVGRMSWLIETRKMLSFKEFAESGGVERGSRRYVPFDKAGIEGALDFLLTMA